MSTAKKSDDADCVTPGVNQRMIRLVRALLHAPVTRKEADRIAGCANSPDLISDIRHLGVGRINLNCIMIPVIDLDGKASRAGLYSLTTEGKAMLTAWLSLFTKVPANEATK